MSGKPLLPLRVRKFIGTVLMLALAIAFPLCAMAVAVRVMPDAGVTPWWLQVTFFFMATLLWVLPSMAIIWWMSRPDGAPPQRP